MLAVHLTLTPLAGAPIRVVRALAEHTHVEARLVNLAPDAYGMRTFEEDLAWARDAEQATELVARADVLHLHHPIDLDSAANPFGVAFRRLLKPGARVLLQWHSSPEFVLRCHGDVARAWLESDAPQATMAQYHERLYPRARPLPLVVELGPAPLPAIERERPLVFFAPSTPRSAHAERWETKGAPEVLRVLRALEKRRVLDVLHVHDVPFERCRELRRTADVVLDDVVTGSYHTTTLEALADGKAAVAHLDPRTRVVLAALARADELPIVDVHLEHLERALEALATDLALVREIGALSRAWMERRYAERDVVAHYVRAYEELLATGALAPPHDDGHARARAFLHRELPDLAWTARHSAFHPAALGARLRSVARSLRDGSRGSSTVRATEDDA